MGEKYEPKFGDSVEIQLSASFWEGVRGTVIGFGRDLDTYIVKFGWRNIEVEETFGVDQLKLLYRSFG